MIWMNFWEQRTRQPYGAPPIQSKPAVAATALAIPERVQASGREHAMGLGPLIAFRAKALIENIVLGYAAAFGLLAMGLAAIGVFGWLSYHVASRTPEIGLRMALGAETGQISDLVLGQITIVMASGIGGGLVLAELVGRTMQGRV